MLSFNPHTFGNMLRARLRTLTRAWCCCFSLKGNGYLASLHSTLHDPGYMLWYAYSPVPKSC